MNPDIHHFGRPAGRPYAIGHGLRAFFSFLTLFFSISGYLWAETVSLTILHTNDTHSHLLPFNYPAAPPPGSELASLSVHSNIGGIARRATLVERLRAELSLKGTDVWLVDAGDFSDGTPFSIEYRGAADAAAMNAVGYTFGTLGNHEFNNSFSQLTNLLHLFQYPILCANVTRRSTGALLTQASAIRKVGPLSIAVFGLLTNDASGYPAARKNLVIADEMQTARAMAQSLHQKADIVIALSHCGEAMDKRLAETISGIDIIIGGHSHSRLPFGEVIARTKKGKTRSSEETIIVQAHQWGGELGRLDLAFEKNPAGHWQVVRHKASLIAITDKIPEDPAVAAVVDRYWKPIAARYGEIVGQASADFVDRGNDLPAYNLMADSLRETFETDIALENMGGVRAPLVKGNITRGDLATMDPFDNTVVTFRILGRQLRRILQTQRPAVSGMEYRLERGILAAATVAGKPLADSQVYTASTNSFFARTALKGIRTQNTGRQRLDVMTDYIRTKKTVHPVYDGRRIVLSNK